MNKIHHNELVAVSNKGADQGIKRGSVRLIGEQSASILGLVLFLVVILLLLSACAPANFPVASQVDTPPTTALADSSVAPESTAEPESTPTLLPTPTEDPTQTATPEPTPTLEATPIPPEVPFRVNDKVVEKWAFNLITNQEEWLPDETFPVIKRPDRSNVSIIEKINSVTYIVNGGEVTYFGAVSAVYGDVEAIFINGEWVPVTDINPSEFIAPLEPGEVRFANENWSNGHQLVEPGATEFFNAFRQALIDGNQKYFEWFVGGSDISLSNVLAVAATRNYMLPVPPDGVPRLLPPIQDNTRYSTEFAQRNRNSNSEINVDVNFGEITILIFTPDQIKNDPVLAAVVERLPKTHLLATYTLERAQYGIVVLLDGSMVWVHGEEVGPEPDATAAFRSTLFSQTPEEFSNITRAHAEAYIEAMRMLENESVRVAPLDPYRYDEPGMIEGDEVGLSLFIE